MKTALTIAGSDSSGGAGIQADLKSFSANGVFGMSVITAITAQNTQAVTDVFELPVSIIEAQLDAIYADIAVGAVKTGMMASAPIIEAVSARLTRLNSAPLVVDPVMVSTSGSHLLRPDAVTALKTLLIPQADLITPNLPEAEVLIGAKLTTRKEIEEAARELTAGGAKAVLIKGGHSDGDHSVDILFDGKAITEFSSRRMQTNNTHGTGCTLASAIAAWLAQGVSLAEAVRNAKVYIEEAIRHGASWNIGHGHGPVDHFYRLRTQR